MEEELYQIGAIATTHGIRGEVKVFPMTDDWKRFKGLKGAILKTRKGQMVLDVESARAQNNMVIVKFKGIDTLNEVETWKGAGLFVKKEDRVPLQQDEYFIADLIGCSVYTEEEELLGFVSDVLQTAANDVIVVKREGKKELLIPSIKDCILKVDTDGRRLDVHLLEGLGE